MKMRIVSGLALFTCITTLQGRAQVAPPITVFDFEPFGACQHSLRDQADPSHCVVASSVPLDGALLPLGDHLFVDPRGRVGLGTKSPGSSLDIEATFSEPLTGTLTVPIGATMVLGVGTQFTQELVAGDSLLILGAVEAENEVFLVETIQSDTILDVSRQAQSDHFVAEGFVTSDLLNVGDGVLSIDRQGHVGIGVSNPSVALEVSGEIRGFGVVPMGTILPWHKSLAGTPALPEGWAECNGQTLAEPGSPYDGTTLPDLNATGRFLRGGAVSGTLQADAMASHVATASVVSGTVGGSDGAHTHGVSDPGHSHNVTGEDVEGNDKRFLLSGASGGGDSTQSSTTGISVTSAQSSHGHGFSLTAAGQAYAGDTETRPLNMSVVWIMRIR